MAKRKKTKRQTTIFKTYTHNTKDRVTRTLLITGGELGCSTRLQLKQEVRHMTISHWGFKL